MKIGPLFKWYGSKWLSAKHYPPPEHDTIIEPYAGAAGYSCNHAEKTVLLWEDDPHVRELWTWLIDKAKPQDILDIPVDLPVGTDIRSIGLSRGQALLLKHWQRTNNVGDCWTVSPWGHLPGQWTRNTRSRVAEEVEAIWHWVVREPDVNWTPATWFIDPPYLHHYRYRKSLPSFDHQALARMVGEIDARSQVIVCEAVGKNGEIPNYLPFKPSHLSVTSRRKPTQSHHSRELIYVRPMTEKDRLYEEHSELSEAFIMRGLTPAELERMEVVEARLGELEHLDRKKERPHGRKEKTKQSSKGTSKETRTQARKAGEDGEACEG